MRFLALALSLIVGRWTWAYVQFPLRRSTIGTGNGRQQQCPRHDSLLLIPTGIEWTRASPLRCGAKRRFRGGTGWTQERGARFRTSLYAGPSSTTAVLQVEHLTYTHDGEVFPLQDVSYVLPRGARVALVGRNGAGKSSLLHVLAGRYMAAEGQIITPRGVRVVLVEQEPPLFGNTTVEDALLGLNEATDTTSASGGGRKDVYAVVRHYRSALRNDDPSVLARASSLMEETEGAWQVLTKAEEVATKLRVWHLRDSTVDSLSGGERKRLALAAALTQEPDVLLLDEPTNFLSLAGVQWLSDYLQQEKRLSLLMVTHDRAFLEEVCDRILELDQGKLYETLGSYSAYLQAKEERFAAQDAAVQSAKARYRIELDWMRRQPQARETKSKARIDAFYKLQRSTQPRPRDPQLQLEGGESRRLGSKILSMRHCDLRFGDKVILKDFSYDFCKGDRICVSGMNGAGKTSFVRVLTGQVPPDSGTVEVGETIVMGVYDQVGIQLDDPDQTVLDFVTERVREGTTDAVLSSNEARALLKHFEFPRKRWSDRVSVLSGGERRRLQMLSVFSRKPNFLVLDEPSVDCDLDTLQALEQYLQEFDGVLLIVSHDRSFADKVTDHLFIFHGGGEVTDFIGSLSEYASTLIEIETDAFSTQGQDVDLDQKRAFQREDKVKRNEARNVIRKAKKDMSNLERDIDRLKEHAKKLQHEIDASSDKGWSVLAELTDKINALSASIDAQELAWMELAEQVEELEAEA